MELKTVVALVGIAALSYLFLPGALAVGTESILAVLVKGGLATLGAVMGLLGTKRVLGIFAAEGADTL